MGARTAIPDAGKISLRLSGPERHELVVWAAKQVHAQPALRGRLLHIDGRPKISAILRYAALEKAKEGR